MPKAKTISKAFKSFLGPSVAPVGSSPAPLPGIPTAVIPIGKPPPHDLVLNNLATTCRITRDAAESLSKIPYIKAVTGVVAQIIKIYEEVQGNKERCNEITSMVTKYAYTVIECLAELYTTEGEHRLEALKAELKSFQSFLENLLIDVLEPMSSQSAFKTYVKRDTDAEDMRKIERELTGFVNRFLMKGVSASIRSAEAAKPLLSEMQHAILRDQWLLSQHAQYNVAIIGVAPGSIDRALCAPGTRLPVLERITTWACDRSADSPAVFWMVGEGGSGKSTIARTIAKKLDEDSALPDVVTFFCSRKFSDTNHQVFIIPTIAYQLTGLCPYYAAELLKDANIVRSLRVISKQMNSLLVQPWTASSSSRSHDLPPFLVIIDALDEITSHEDDNEMSGGFVLLESLLKAVEQGYLKGLKFLVTSRPHPRLAEICQALTSETVCRLYDIPKDEVEQDICRYLHHRLPKLQTPADNELLQRVATKADGLFIFASTAVLMAKPTSGTTMQEQRHALQQNLDGHPLENSTVSPIDSLYCQIMGETFEYRHGKALIDRMDLLHTAICTEDRVSVDVLVHLVWKDGDDLESAHEMVEDLLHRLHAVLWISDERITWYHASFLDFLFSSASRSIVLPKRNLDASCNTFTQHAVLARRCFRVMRSSLRFNICGLPSSFLLDSEVEDLTERINERIPPVLRYVSRYWAVHTSKGLGIDMQEDIEQFLTDYLLFWIEVMNLVQQSSLCAMLLKVVQEYVIHRYPEAHGLRANLSAASHFSATFKGSPASKSTPQLYMSTLVYAAQRFPSLQKWRRQFARLPKMHMQGIGTHLLMTLKGHTGWVMSVALSPDGARIGSGSFDKSVRVWDVESGDEIRKYEGHTEWVNSVAFSPDGIHVISGSTDKTLRIWEVKSGLEIRRLDGHMDAVYSIAVCSDGSRIVSGSGDKSIRVWDFRSGEEVLRLDGHTSSVESVAFSTNGTRVVSGSNDNSIRVWDLDLGEEIRRFSGHKGNVKSVAFSPDGTRIVSGSGDMSVRVWEVESGKEMKRLDGHAHSVDSVAFSADGSHIVSGSSDCSVRIWDAESGEEIRKLDGHSSEVVSVTFSSDGTRIFSGSCDHYIRHWDVESGGDIHKLDGHTDRVNSIASSPNGTLIVSGSDDKSVRIWDAKSGAEIQRLDRHRDAVNSVAFSPEGTRIASGSYDHSIAISDAKYGAEIRRFSDSESIRCLVFSPNGARIAYLAENSVWIWDAELEYGHEIRNNDTRLTTSIAFAPDSTRIVLGSAEHSLGIWDVQSGNEIVKIDCKTGYITSVSFSPDGTRIASGTYEKLVQVWDVQDAVEVRRFSGHTKAVNTIAFSSNGGRIVSGSGDGSVRVWNVASGEEIQRFDGHSRGVFSVVFSSDDTLIISGSSDHSIRVWDVELAEKLQKLKDRKEDAQHLVPGTANTSKGDLSFKSYVGPLSQLNWKVDEDGWIIQIPNMNRIMWLPDTMLSYLYRPTNKLVISQQTVSLDFIGMAAGADWGLCYSLKS